MKCQRMQRYWFLGIALPILMILLASDASSFAAGREIPKEEQVSFGGSIITRAGTSIEVLEFLSPLKDNYIQGEYEGRMVKIKGSDLKEIVLLDVGCGYGWYFHGPQWKGRMRITYPSGKTLEISSADFCAYNLQDGQFQFKVYNEALGKNETRQIMTTRIARILINDVATRSKACGQTNELREYDPHRYALISANPCLNKESTHTRRGLFLRGHFCLSVSRGNPRDTFWLQTIQRELLERSISLPITQLHAVVPQ